MNERIKQLSDIAYKNHLARNRNSSFGRRTDYDKEFAELIVKECVQTLIDTTLERYASEDDWDRGYAQAIEDCVHHIQEHFGVEE